MDKDYRLSCVSLGGLLKTKDRAASAREIDSTGGVLPEGRDALPSLEENLRLPIRPLGWVGCVQQPPNQACTVIPVEIDASPLTHLSSEDIAADNRAAALCVIVLGHRHG